MWLIKPAENGYILSQTDGDSVQVFEANGESKRHILSMLYALLDMTGERGSKHDEQRIKISIIDRDGKEIDGN